MKIIHLKNIPTDNIHNNSVFRKSLLKIGDIKGEIQTMNFAWLEKDMTLEKHVHDDCVEYFLILEGNGTISISDNNFNIKKGDLITIEKSEDHSFQNTGDNKLEFISLRVKTNL